MPIQVVCGGCQKRFQVSDQFAGQTGPCPNCKASIKIPQAAGDAVVVHEPEQFGPKGADGRAVLKPIEREETQMTIPAAAGLAGVIAAIFLGAFFLRNPPDGPPQIVLVAGALLLAPLLIWAGYAFLRDDELEAYRGKELYVRIVVCSLVYAFMWGVYRFIPWYLQLDQFEIFHLAFVAPPIVLVAAFATFAAFDLEYGWAAVHFGFYVVVTTLLCLVMGIDLLQFSN
ncbi:MAG: hypothetical protein MK165_10130 [Pirellulaceae bacterium]|nr:hypothetical protein [Pirellulaceae bacterium]